MNEGEKALIKVLIKWSFLPSGFPICLCRHTHTQKKKKETATVSNEAIVSPDILHEISDSRQTL